MKKSGAVYLNKLAVDFAAVLCLKSLPLLELQTDYALGEHLTTLGLEHLPQS